MSGWAKRCWSFRTPIEPDASFAAYAFWIEKSRTDPWSWDDLSRAVGTALDNGLELPPPLARWAAEKAAERRPQPSQRRPINPRRDAGIAAVVMLMVETGSSQSQAFHTIGDILGMSPKTIESARRRALTL